MGGWGWGGLDSCGDAGFDQGMDRGEQVFREQGLQSEVDTETLILILGFGEAADDEHGEIGGELAEAHDELRTVHAGHEVVGDDEVDGVGIVVVAKLFESTLGAENGEDDVAGTLEDGLTGRCLDGVVVDEKQGMRHVFLRPW
jgi:hypothetical protein